MVIHRFPAVTSTLKLVAERGVAGVQLRPGGARAGRGWRRQPRTAPPGPRCTRSRSGIRRAARSPGRRAGQPGRRPPGPARSLSARSRRCPAPRRVPVQVDSFVSVRRARFTRITGQRASSTVPTCTIHPAVLGSWPGDCPVTGWGAAESPMPVMLISDPSFSWYWKVAPSAPPCGRAGDRPVVAAQLVIVGGVKAKIVRVAVSAARLARRVIQRQRHWLATPEASVR